MKTISAAGLAERSPDGNAVLLDVRAPHEFAEAHIEGSWNVPLPDLAKYKAEVEAKSQGRELVVVCRTGRRAASGCEKLAELGLSGATVLDGGIEAWMAAGHAVKHEGRSGMSLERQVRVAAGAMVVIGAALSWFVHPAFVAISAFVGCGLVFAGLTDTCGMAMILARLPMNRLR